MADFVKRREGMPYQFWTPEQIDAAIELYGAGDYDCCVQNQGERIAELVQRLAEVEAELEREQLLHSNARDSISMCPIHGMYGTDSGCPQCAVNRVINRAAAARDGNGSLKPMLPTVDPLAGKLDSEPASAAPTTAEGLDVPAFLKGQAS